MFPENFNYLNEKLIILQQKVVFHSFSNVCNTVSYLWTCTLTYQAAPFLRLYLLCEWVLGGASPQPFSKFSKCQSLLTIVFDVLEFVYYRKNYTKMYIKNIVLDGFKSYAQRTEVNGFDPLFNAITGLNGSGKSNILDSICFLLGITNLSHVSSEAAFYVTKYSRMDKVKFVEDSL